MKSKPQKQTFTFKFTGVAKVTAETYANALERAKAIQLGLEWSLDEIEVESLGNVPDPVDDVSI